MPHLTLVRGLPGSGKSTYARGLLALHFEADQFFVYMNGKYEYDRNLIGVAHDWCFSNTVKALRCGYDCVVSNTFTTTWEMDRYFAIPGWIPDVEISLVEMRTHYGTIHDVPEEKLKLMASRWEEIPQEWIDDGLNFLRIE